MYKDRVVGRKWRMVNGDCRLKGKRITERRWKVVPESTSRMRERTISYFERRALKS